VLIRSPSRNKLRASNVTAITVDAVRLSQLPNAVEASCSISMQTKLLTALTVRATWWLATEPTPGSKSSNIDWSLLINAVYCKFIAERRVGRLNDGHGSTRENKLCRVENHKLHTLSLCR
jgi:hypothetical protein